MTWIFFFTSSLMLVLYCGCYSYFQYYK